MKTEEILVHKEIARMGKIKIEIILYSFGGAHIFVYKQNKNLIEFISNFFLFAEWKSDVCVLLCL